MWDLPQYTSSNLVFNGFSQSLSKKGTWASKTILRIFCRSFSVYLAIRGLEGLIAGELTRLLSWVEFRKGENFEEPSEVHSLQGHPWP